MDEMKYQINVYQNACTENKIRIVFGVRTI